MNNLTKYKDPFSSLSGLHSQLDDLFNGFFSSSLPSISSGLPAMDVYTEDDKSLVAEVHLPGYDKDDVEISIHEGNLEIRGEKRVRDEQKEGKKSYMVKETSSSFYRRIVLPKYANTDKIEADLENGVLKVTVPFKELPQPKKVAIKAGK